MITYKIFPGYVSLVTYCNSHNICKKDIIKIDYTDYDKNLLLLYESDKDYT